PLKGRERCSSPLKGRESCSSPLKGRERCSSPLKGRERCSSPLKGRERCSSPFKGEAGRGRGKVFHANTGMKIALLGYLLNIRQFLPLEKPSWLAYSTLH
ncbi:MAG: hypothetical protein Q8O31_01395, partial [Rhodocyclaceae bacterium]|nr:hypothetical protein [Rhodocyclaceae bacterium]